MYKCLDEILYEYGFIAKSKNVFRKYKNNKEDISISEMYFTKAGAKAYLKLLSLLQDIAILTDTETHYYEVIEPKLDTISSEN